MPYSFLTSASICIRLLSPLGRYPDRCLLSSGGRLLIDDDVALTAVKVAPQGEHGIGVDAYSELEFLTLEEVRYLAAVMLSLRPDRGMIYVYSLPITVQTQTADDDKALLKLARTTLESMNLQHPYWRGAVLPPYVGGPSYERHHEQINDTLLSDLMRRIEIQDHLLLRGLGALLKADMLWVRRELQEAAVQMLFVAMEASFQMVLRHLRMLGLQNPSARDAGAFVDLIFNVDTGSRGYFVEYYEDRIRAMHPSSRFGVFAFPPLQADDFYHLRADLVAVFVFLVTGHIWPDLWS